MKGNAIVGQSGGPTAVINASLVGAVDEALKAPDIENVYGMRFGIEGFMQDMLVDMGAQSRATLDAVKATPSSALGSCRHKLTDADFEPILRMFKRHNVRYFFMIGGNDTMDTINRVATHCRQQGHELNAVGVPKTVDNDLHGTDHTPGYGSAATYVACSVAQGGILARDMQKVDKVSIFQTVGRDAGWLAAAGALAKRGAADAPHLVYVPERPFDMDRCIKDAGACIDRYGYCSIVCGEGICFADGTAVSSSTTQDKFANLEFGAMGGASAAMAIHRVLCDTLDVRGEFQVTESLQMCASDRASRLDREEAYLCGVEAVRLAAAGATDVMVSLVRPDGEYETTFGATPLAEVAVRSKPMPPEYINEQGNFPTDAFLDYVRPLVGEIPAFASLDVGASGA